MRDDASDTDADHVHETRIDDDRIGDDQIEEKRIDDERADDEPPEWSESEPARGPGRREDVAGVATDRTPGWLDNRARWLLVAVGLILVFVPEPVTSMIGLGFVIGGILLWVADLFE